MQPIAITRPMTNPKAHTTSSGAGIILPTGLCEPDGRGTSLTQAAQGKNGIEPARQPPLGPHGAADPNGGACRLRHLGGASEAHLQTGLYVGISAQLALKQRLDTVANNMANVNTPGFRAEETKFETYLSGNPNYETS